MTRAASCPGPGQPCGWDYLYSPEPNPHDLLGALVGGPDSQDFYQDERTNYVVSGPRVTRAARVAT